MGVHNFRISRQILFLTVVVVTFAGLMKFMRNIRSAIGRRMLAREPEPARQRQGSNFTSAEKIGLLYLDEDEATFKMVKGLQRELKENFSIRTVKALGFVNSKSKHTPVYQSHKLELEFFTRDELNWYMKPPKSISAFVKDEFDILIDLSGGDILPLNFIFKESNARMKVSPKNSRAARSSDLLIDMGTLYDKRKFLDQINIYLSNSRIK